MGHLTQILILALAGIVALFIDSYIGLSKMLMSTATTLGI